MSSIPDMRPTLGAALAGCMAAVGLSAVLGFQTFLYFQIFPSDSPAYKTLVAWIWATDAAHTALICTAVWQYLIVNFTNTQVTETIFPAISITVALTSVITLSVNAFYGYRIHKLSKRNWWWTGPIVFLTIVRVGLASATTSEMLLSQTFSAFAARFKILFTSGLAVSAITDVLVSFARYYFLRNVRQGYSMTHEAVDAVVVFTLNDGCLTCAVVILSIVCWLTMHNWIYLGIYFTIAKLYANSVLATLNLRNWYRHQYIGARPIQMKHSVGVNIARTEQQHPAASLNLNKDDREQPTDSTMPVVEVYIDQQVEFAGSLSGDRYSSNTANKVRHIV